MQETNQQARGKKGLIRETGGKMGRRMFRI